VRVHPGHGFRVTAQANDPGRAAPVAFILTGRLPGGKWTSFCEQLLAALHRAAEGRSWSMLGIGTTDRSTAEIVEQIKAARVSGLVLDTSHQPLTRALAAQAMPMVMVEESGREARLDCAAQDNFGGGFMAAEHLAARGHRRVGWFGPLAATPASRERWGGAMAALRDAGAAVAPAHSISSDAPDAAERLRKALSRRDRPTALLALWWEHAVVAGQVAAEAGLALDRDLEIAAWCPEEQLAEFRGAFPGGRLPATVTWSMSELAEAALGRLADRRARPDGAAVRISVEARLLAAETQGAKA
jgi:DNA-binding LacI/PurR family transcriptional regulator